MIGFFRKIRKKLADDNKPLKYMRYAVGEIVLVVIGILIALSINNWNELNKERKSEKIILNEIRDNLKFDLEDFESNIANLQNKATSCKSILKILESNSAYNDSVGFFFYYLKTYPHFSNKSNGYNLLQSKGLDIIQNDSIRKGITDLYEDRYKYLKTYEKERIDYNNSLENKITPYYGTRTLSKDSLPNEIVIKGSVKILLQFGFFRNIRNYDLLKKDLELRGIIKDIETWATILGATHNGVRNDVLELIKQIEKELEIN
ncbi:DUF6090 family protein [Eudoraea sp.]|uniref:DUF6090 family protein n=1 Tax=Eudoraea sp. TaxID=1979955 RepID=UPI003C774BDD